MATPENTWTFKKTKCFSGAGEICNLALSQCQNK